MCVKSCATAVLIAITVCCHVRAVEPTEEQVSWVKEHAIPFKTVEAENGFEDLAPLKELIGDARIVSLGESTHGSREIFQMKHRLVEFLASEMGFTIFSIEASMPESYRLNDYVLGGSGDPEQLIAGLYFWTWNTEEVLDMVEWMRRFNRMGNGRIAFTGFDMQHPTVAMENVLDFLAERDADLHSSAGEAYKKVEHAVQLSGGESGVATGRFPVDEARGKKIIFSGWIKTQDIKNGFAGLWWRADGKNREVLAFNNMAANGPRGTTAWKRYSIELDVPEATVNVSFGVLMPGKGKAWFDGLEVKLDNKVYEDESFDFDFESETVKGLTVIPRRTYRTRLDKQVAKVGKQSLLFESIDGGISAAKGLQFAKDVVASLTEARDELSERVEKKEFEWILQNARIVRQSLEMRSGSRGNVRDLSMAENVGWILEQNPQAKIVLWAHNGHVAKRMFGMGKHLDKKFGDKHLAVAFATAKGKYQAFARGKGLSEHPLEEPPAGSVESVFQRTGMPRFVLDLRKAEEASAASGWLSRSTPFRSIGAMAKDRQFVPQSLHDLYDAVIYIEETSRARPIRR